MCIRDSIYLAHGSDYSRAYRHFRNNHSKPLNIGLHLLGLAHLALANFALLACADRALFGTASPYIATATLFCTISLLGLCVVKAPVLARVGGIAILGAAFCGRTMYSEHWRTVVWLEGCVHVLNFKYGDAKAVPIVPEALPLWSVCLLRAGVHGRSRSFLVGALKRISCWLCWLLSAPCVRSTTSSIVIGAGTGAGWLVVPRNSLGWFSMAQALWPRCSRGSLTYGLRRPPTFQSSPRGLGRTEHRMRLHT
eukprot:TRINITY_DN34682_c0_g1_i1.p1 TRINITY_DN34682_c0_g1~~TRINITY_DN34682_c0_g1_i1.p1  ORF type:complete len:252 (-),score=19.52 TRINITY_DN34682_c0_g1_i1:94-849(-)